MAIILPAFNIVAGHKEVNQTTCVLVRNKYRWCDPKVFVMLRLSEVMVHHMIKGRLLFRPKPASRVGAYSTRPVHVDNFKSSETCKRLQLLPLPEEHLFVVE